MPVWHFHIQANVIWTMQFPNYISMLYAINLCRYGRRLYGVVQRWWVVQGWFLCCGDSFEEYLKHLEMVLRRCVDSNFVLNWEKCHFMVKEGILLVHKIFGEGIEVDQAKIQVIKKYLLLISVKGSRSFLGHVGFYRWFIKDFSKIAIRLCRLLEKESTFIFNDSCMMAFKMVREKLIWALIIISPDWNLPF